MFFTNNYEFKNERLRTKTPEKPEPAAIRIPDNLVILTGQLWNLFQDLSNDKLLRINSPK
ncbi:MAG: hypothetical protein LBK53_00240 [Heliobacteriaceae bacterium]|jgi:hypothetical protein|nr:hypothetical protein [Heliobacteriaceae bacterium]